MKKILVLGMILCVLVAGLLAGMQTTTRAAGLEQLTSFATPTPGSDGRIIYIVQAGESVWLISALSGVPIETIRELNGLGADDMVYEGDELLLGYAGPVGVTPTTGPTPTTGAQLPTATPSPGWGILCILLYEDLNGDAIRQESEVSIPGGAVSVGNRRGTVALSAETPSGGISDLAVPTPQDLGYVCFEELPEGEYTASAAHPEGYNATTELNKAIRLAAGQTTLVAFGIQPNAEAAAEPSILPQTPGRSPLLGILGGVVLLFGLGMGIYAALLQRSNRFKRLSDE